MKFSGITLITFLSTPSVGFTVPGAILTPHNTNQASVSLHRRPNGLSINIVADRDGLEEGNNEKVEETENTVRSINGRNNAAIKAKANTVSIIIIINKWKY